MLHETYPHILVVSKSVSIMLTFYCNFNMNAQTLSVVTAFVSCSQKHQTACLSMTTEISVLQISGCFKTLPRCHSMFPVTEMFCPMGWIWCYKYKVHGQIIILTFLFNKERISHILYEKRDCTVVPKPGLSLLPPAYSSLRSLPCYSLPLPRQGLSLEWVCWLSHAHAWARNDLYGVRRAPMGFSGSTAVTSSRGTRANTCHQLPKWLQLFAKLMPPGFSRDYQEEIKKQTPTLPWLHPAPPVHVKFLLVLMREAPALGREKRDTCLPFTHHFPHSICTALVFYLQCHGMVSHLAR